MIQITIKGENGKDIVLGGEGGSGEKKLIKELKIQLDTPNDNAKSRDEAIMAKISFRGEIASSNDNDVHSRLIGLFNWAKGYDEEEYRTVAIKIFENDKTDKPEVRSYEFPRMFVCDYTEGYIESKLTFEMKLNQREENVATITTGI